MGIVALEIASGRRPVDLEAKEGKVILVEFIRGLYGQRKILEAADHKLSANFDEKEMTCLMTVRLWCAHPDQELRPSVKQAIKQAIQVLASIYNAYVKSSKYSNKYMLEFLY